jgi:hypothetical protein
MFTRDELRAVPLFSEVADKELDYLAQTSADIRLLPGEYVVHEGDTRRVLFVLLEGRVEVTKFVDGAERVLGIREPGEVFGEVPVVLDTPFLVSFRAAQQSRVMPIEAKDFHTVAASAPNVSAAEGVAKKIRTLQHSLSRLNHPTFSYAACVSGRGVREGRSPFACLRNRCYGLYWFCCCSGANPSRARGAWAGAAGCGREVTYRCWCPGPSGDVKDLDSLRRGVAAADGVIHTAFIHDFSNVKAACETDRHATEALGSTLAAEDASTCRS